MKKTSKRLWALLLSVIMVLSMSMSVFAAADADTITVTVKATMQDETGEIVEAFNEKVTLPKNCSGDGHLFEVPKNVSYDITQPTVADALFAAMEQNVPGTEPLLDTGYPYTETVLSYNWDKVEKPNGLYIIYYNGVCTETVESTAHSWKGYAWMIYKGNIAEKNLYRKYASSETVEDGDVICMNYQYQEENF